MATGLTFDTNSLQTANILTAQIDHSSIDKKEAKLYTLARANKSVISAVNYPSRTVRIAGKLIASSIAAMDTLEDTFKGYLRGTDKNLDIAYAGGTRRYIATVESLTIEREGGLSHANFEVIFTCTLPFGVNIVAEDALSETGRTGNSYVDTHVFVGNAPYQLPIITITLTAVTGGGSFLSFGNDNTGQSINITDQTFVNGDVVVIDTEDRVVYLNGQEIDYTGAFPMFEPGSQDFSYTDGFTTRTFNIDVSYYALFL